MHEIQKKKCVKCIEVVSIVFIMLLFLSMKGIAAGNEDILYSEIMDVNALSVLLPDITERESSPFDFILDPFDLVYKTDAMRYGGGTVEGGATMLFHNEAGKYDFSNCSDWLSITNLGDEPVMVTISISISELAGIDLIDKDDFSENENPSIYFAVIDDQGNEQPISEEGESIICVKLGTGIYSFALTGTCNSSADWKETNVHPQIMVTWFVESMETKEKLDAEADKTLNENEGGLALEPEDLQQSSANEMVLIDEETDEIPGHELDSESINDSAPGE